MATRQKSPYADRRTAALNGHRRYYTGEECKHGHKAERFTSNGGCTLCVNQTVATIAAYRNVRSLPKPIVFPAGGVEPTAELMDFIHGEVQRILPHLIAAFRTAHPELIPRDPFEGYRPTAKCADLQAFIKLGWTHASLLQHGYIELIPTTPTE